MRPADDADAPLSPARRNVDARRRAREAREVQERAEYVHPSSCTCGTCETFAALDWHERMKRLAPPRPPRVDFSPFREDTWGASARGGIA